MDPKNQLDAGLVSAREILAASARVAAFSGAGLSADSGLPTFRDAATDALWSRYDPSELASVSGFQAHPQRVIDWYDWRRSQYAKVSPNAAHLALAAQPRMLQVTQNVDDLLERAGVAAARVYHLHGSIMFDRCDSRGCDYSERIDPGRAAGLRACPVCGDRLRPAVVWFGESLDQEVWNAAQRLCLNLDCLLVIGTSATVYPAAGLIQLARESRSRIIVIDPNPGAAGALADVYLQANAADVLPALLDGFDLASPA